MEGYNWVDYLFLAVFFLSMMAGLSRGFIKEVISIVTWIAAIIIAGKFSTNLAATFTGSPQVQSAISNASTTLGVDSTQSVSMLSIGLSFIAIFIVVMIVGSIIGSVIGGIANLPGIGFLNRILGAAFGLARGFLINVVMVFLVQLSPLQQEAWWQQSQLVPMFKSGAEMIDNLVQPGLEAIKSKVGETLQNVESRYLPNRN